MALRKAIGAVKDRTSIRLAKVSANTSAELKVLIVKATSHDGSPTDEKYYRQIINLTSNSRGYVNTCVGIISKRIRKTRDWVVALKALILVHRLLIDGDPLFEEEILYASRKGVRALTMSEFKDEAHSNSWDHTVFVRFYAMYLDEKVESAVFERKVSEGERKFEEGNAGFGERESRDDFGRESRDDFEYRMPKRSQSYGGFNGYLVRVEQKKEVTPISEMEPERLLGRLDQQIRILDRVFACRPTGMAMNHRLVQLALYDVVKESFGLYSDICEALGVLLERFTDMVYAYCLKGFDLYVGAAKVIDELIEFYGWCKDMGVVRSSECPEVQKVSESLIGTLGEFLREMTNRRTKSPERSTEKKVPTKQEPESGKDEVKALPPPAPEPRQKPKPQPPQVVEDLVNLKDDVVSADEHGNNLALALFSGPPTTNANGAWVAFPSHGDPAATSAGQADWESALVQSASNLSKQKATSGSGFDRLLLNGTYDQSGEIMQHMSSAQLHSRSVNSMAFPGTAGKFGTPALALPAPNGTIQPVGNQDPFAASLAIPPPSYVQVADMERKQKLLVHEKQQQWQQYGRNGMQNQVGFTKISGVSNYYGHNPHSMMMPYGMQQVSSMRQPGGYYYPSY